MVVSFLNQKGGTGKTTLSLAAASYWTRHQKSVLFVDADPQGTASRWAGLRRDADFPVVQISHDKVASEVLSIAPNYTNVVIDGPARGEILSRAVIAVSNLVVIPIEASAASGWSSEVTVAQVEEARLLKPELSAVFVMSRVIPRTVLGTAMRDNMEEVGVNLLNTSVCNRTAFAEALSQGLTIYQWAPNSPASSEINAMMRELEQHIKERKL